MAAPYRVFLIDDEPWVLKGLSALLRWEDEGFVIDGQYTNALTALEDILRLRPDAVITDITMPRIDGLELIERARGAGYEGCFVILTGYDEFAYAQKAIEQQTFSYLLKPIDRSEVRAVMCKLRHELDDRLLRAIAAEPDGDNAALLRRLLGRESGQFYVLTVQGEWEPSLVGAERLLRVRAGKMRSTYLLASETLPERLKERWEAPLANTQSHLGLSEPFCDLAAFARMLRHSETAACDAFLNNGAHVYGYRRADKSFVNRIVSMMRSANDPSVWVMVLHELRKHASMADIALLLSEASARSAANEGDSAAIDSYEIEDISMLFSSLDEVVAYMEGLLDKDDAGKPSSGQTVIADICAWIDENYGRPIRLRMLSRRFHISETYICELFRKHKNQTLTNYVLSARMERAASLLRASKVSLPDVAEAVGYLDYGYFGRVFKRYHGISPDAFRRAN